LEHGRTGCTAARAETNEARPLQEASFKLMRNLARTAIALGSIILACLVCLIGFWLVIVAPFKFGLIHIPETNPGTAARWALNLLPLAAIAVTLIGALLLSIRFYRKFSKRFLSDRISN
jgi:hypothetical protein